MLSVSSLESVAIDTDPLRDLESVSELSEGWPGSSAKGDRYVLGLKPGLIVHTYKNFIIYDWTFNGIQIAV